MRLFWRDQLALICFTALQLAAVAVVFWLDGYRDFNVASYALLLGAAVFLGYLAYRYYTHRRFYALLERGQPRLEESIRSLEFAPLPGALGELLQAQYRHYQNRMIEGERVRRNHITFMNQWVHQMKTPLSVLELLLQDGGEPRDESMREETERIRKGLEMVLYMARLETFEQDFSVETVSLREAVNEVIMDNKRLFIRSFVYPDMQIEEDLKVETDGKWLRFIIQQLISNAVKYSAGTRTKVAVRAYANDRAVMLEVADSGAGIPASDRSRIFQPFFTGENGRRFKESTGMGLYIVKSVLDKMNHEIEVESEPGRGTTVRVIFPYAARQVEPE
ncbi:sensor histidine kinase [Paenibacillus arenilitoris]|uniref:histidine kinase n=1 Tax=Paenibacillus arenilitoris TaxID=2772299 RepID=A0A927H4W5_9BACL|nr:sensor histidine kinase [Paenibacillus arenilitoris]MBD2867812.1 sensor histidine kinase [Paenibacillus arenilitoris]